MDSQLVLQITQEAIKVMFLVSFPLLGVALVVGTIISLFQTVTQIQEQTLSFVPKFIAILLTLLLAFNWIATNLITYTAQLLEGIPGYVK